MAAPKRSAPPAPPAAAGALQNAVAEMATAAPKQRRAKAPAADAADLGRMKQAQSTDRDNSYSY